MSELKLQKNLLLSEDAVMCSYLGPLISASTKLTKVM